MRAVLISAEELSESDLRRWRELSARAIEPNPFFDPDYVLPLARGLGLSAELGLLVVPDGEGWMACMPVQRSRGWHRIPATGLTSWRGHPLYGLLGTPLVAAETAEASLAALVEAAARLTPAAFAAFEWVGCDGPLWDLITPALERHSPDPVPFERFERAVLKRRGRPTYLEETLSSKRRRELRRQMRQLGEELGGEPIVIDRAGDESAYDEFVALEAASRLGPSGTVIAADPDHHSFFGEMCRAFASRDALQMLTLVVEGQTVAMKCNLLAGEMIFCFKIAFDERWARFSPGILLEVEMVRIFHESPGVEMIDSCADAGNPMINRLWPDRRPLATVLLPAAGLKGRLLRPMLVGARTLRESKRERNSR